MASANLSPGGPFFDWKHGQRLFGEDKMRLAPKQTFLFHVFFNINPALQALTVDNQIEVGMLVKSVDLPKFNIDTKPLNSYNRWNLVQTKIKYDPLIIRLHDDSADVVRDFWYAYYSYYFRDADYETSLYQVPYKYATMPAQDWGYSPVNGQTQPFLTSISLYSLYQGKFTEYYLINPVIENWEHGEHTQGENNVVSNTMRIAYEAIHYRTGETSSETVSGFDVIHYDDRPSPIDPPVATSDVITDLNSSDLSSQVLMALNNTVNTTLNSLAGVAVGAVSSLTNAAVSAGLNLVNSSTSSYVFPSLTSVPTTSTDVANNVAANYSVESTLTGPDSFSNTAITSNNYGVASDDGTYNFNMNDAASGLSGD
jgi:hypothetical protein